MKLTLILSLLFCFSLRAQDAGLSDLNKSLDSDHSVNASERLIASVDSERQQKREELFPKNRLVEVELRPDADISYKERRSDWGHYYQIGYSQILPYNYTTLSVDPTSKINFYYDEVLQDKTIPFVEAGYTLKYNFAFGALMAGIGGGLGQIDAKKDGQDFNLTLTQYKFELGLVLDAIFDEPYVAPYASYMGYQLNYAEELGTISKDKSTALTTGYKAGILVQLNWLDDSTSRRSYVDFGLENTYLDIYALKFNDSGVSEDPNLETDVTVGVGLRIEY